FGCTSAVGAQQALRGGIAEKWISTLKSLQFAVEMFYGEGAAGQRCSGGPAGSAPRQWWQMRGNLGQCCLGETTVGGNLAAKDREGGRLIFGCVEMQNVIASGCLSF